MAYNPNEQISRSNIPPPGYNREGTRGDYTGDVNDIGQGLFWADDEGLYNMTKGQTGMLSYSEFKERYGGVATRGQYDLYETSYKTRGINNQRREEQGLTDTYWQDMQQFMQAQPGYEAYSKFIPDYLDRLTRLQEGQIDPFTGQLTVAQDPRQAQMMDYLGGDIFGGIDRRYDEIGGRFRSVKEEFLPAMDVNYQETVVNPMQEKLNRMGLGGSTPGMEMTAGAGQGYAIQRAQAGAAMDQQFAGQMMGVEQARQGAWMQSGGMLGNLIGADEARQRANIGTTYQDYMMRQQDQFQRLGLAGQAMGTSAGALSSMAGQAIGAAEIPFAQGSAWDMAQWEMGQMAPYYETMSQPIETGGGGK